MSCCHFAAGQVIDTLNPASLISKDTLNMQDTTNTPKGKEKKRERRDKKEEQEPVIYKDSTRLALENLTRTAVRKSMIIPGWGQIQNGRWWKAPLVVGGFVGIYMSYDFARTNYRIYLKEAQYRAVNPGQGVYENEEFANINSQSIIAAKDFYRRNRDLSVLAGLGFYAIQAIDAYVDAKFFRYDISDDFSFNLAPSFEPTPWMLSDNRLALGLKVSFRVH
jgi:hypothetical protein